MHRHKWIILAQKGPKDASGYARCHVRCAICGKEIRSKMMRVK